MKPTEYWVCAIRAREPECWDGPYQTAAEARKVRNDRFPGDKFVVCRVSCEVVADPVPRARAKAVTTLRRKFTR